MAGESKFVLEFYKSAGDKVPELKVRPSRIDWGTPSPAHLGGGGASSSTRGPLMRGVHDIYITTVDQKIIMDLYRRSFENKGWDKVAYMEEWKSGKWLLRRTVVEFQNVLVSSANTQGYGSDSGKLVGTFGLTFSDTNVIQ